MVMDFFAAKDINNARQRLDRLILGEVAAYTAEILGRVDGLERKLMDGEPTHSAPNTPPIKYTSL
jgi:hypothetical protein